MKNSMKAKLMAMLLCATMIFSVSCTFQNINPLFQSTTEDVNLTTPENPESSQPQKDEAVFPENGAKKIVSQIRKVYSSAEVVEEMTFAHYEDTPDILLIDAETACELVFDSLLSDYSEYEIEETDTTLTIKRDNGSYCVLNFVEDSIYFNDFDLFRVRFLDSTSDLLMSEYVDPNGNKIYFNREDYTNIAGDPVYLNLAERDIPLDIYEGKKYIPFQTVNDLFISPFEIIYLFNSKDLFKLSFDATLDPALEEEYYSIEPAQRSEALANFTVNELCLVLDLYYGLQDEHGITNGFKRYFERVGLLDDLLSSDPTKANAALASLLVGYLADKHSDLLMASPYTGAPSIDYNYIKYDTSLWHYWDFCDLIYAVRAEVMPDGVPGYQEIGNTAYITFDSFTLSTDRFWDYTEDSDKIDDTIGLIIYAHSMINREDSPIENVVLDLSCNSGGYVDAGVYVIAWMLGYCDFHIANPNTNSFSTTTYTIDANFDGVFDKNDSIADKNLYCIISPLSFSCSNSVAAWLKESGKVTLIGNTTGGGACAVQFMSAADGSLFAFSTSYLETVFSNGSYYGIDRGIDPHIYLTKLENYFDRDALTEYINNLK